MTPPVTVNPYTAAAAMAVLRGARTCREVADAAGVSVNAAWHHLQHARREGLVTFDSKKAGTMRPNLCVVWSERQTDPVWSENDRDVRRAGFHGFEGCPRSECPTPFRCSERGSCPEDR